MTKEFEKEVIETLEASRDILETHEKNSNARAAIYNEDTEINALYVGYETAFRFAKELVENDIKYLKKIIILEDKQKCLKTK